MYEVDLEQAVDWNIIKVEKPDAAATDVINVGVDGSQWLHGIKSVCAYNKYRIILDNFLKAFFIRYQV